MALGNDLQKKLSKNYEPSAVVEIKYKRHDLCFKTDEDGNATLLFIGKKTERGTIKGERYTRTSRKDKEGKILKDHWELKGKAT